MKVSDVNGKNTSESTPILIMEVTFLPLFPNHFPNSLLSKFLCY